MKKIVYVMCVALLVQLFGTGNYVSATETGANSEETFGKGYVELADDTLEEDKYLPFSLFSVDAEMSGGDGLPSSYRSDQVSANDVTVSYLPDGFRNQGSYGSCWSFSALGACEASLIRKGLASGAIDLSERHLAYYFYNKGNTPDPKGGTSGDYNVAYPYAEKYLDAGGNSALTMWHLASWCGPVAESVAPYSGITSLTTDSAGLLGKANTTAMAYEADACHVQNVYKIALGDMSARIGQKAIVKELIMEYGALGMSYYADGPFDSAKYDSYYNDTYTSQNHAVQVVGWDDVFPKEHFVKEAPGDGAWLMKNSWGGESAYDAERGYFWLSYYDASINYNEAKQEMPYAYVFDAEPADNYDHIYQYDGDSGTAYVPLSTTQRMANRFTAGDGKGTWEVLRAVGVGVAQSNVTGTVEIYKNLTDPTESPTSGEKVLSQKFSLQYPGYHTIKLDEAVELPDGCEFSVVFQFDRETEIYLSLDTAQNFVRFVTDENEGVSFYQGGSGTWYDLVLDDIVSGCEVVARIKAYTDSMQAEDVEELAISDTEVTVEEGSSLQISANVPAGMFLTWNSQNKSVATVTKLDEKCARITGVAPGSTVITVTDGTDMKQCLVTVTEKPATDNSGEVGDSGNTDSGKDDDSKTEVSEDGEDDDEVVTPAILTKLKLNKTTATLVDGKTLQLKATPTYSGENATEWMVYWKSSDSSVAKVTNYGKVTAVKPGKATITVYNGSVKAKCVVTVKPGKTTLSSISLTSKGKAKLKWKKTDGVSGYVIYRATSEKGTYKKAKTIKGGSVVTATLDSYTESKPYYYKIRAYKTISGENVYGEYSSVKICEPEQTTLSSVTLTSSGKAKLKWKKADGVAGYVIYRATSEKGTYKKVKTVKDGSVTTATLAAYTGSKPYYYKIRAYRTISGKSVYGEYSSVKTCGPKKVSSVKSSAQSGKKIKLTWKKTSNASGYVIYRATSKNGTYKKVKTITKAKTVTYTNKSLKKGKKYYYKIRAYRLIKGKKVYGPYSAVVSAKAK